MLRPTCLLVLAAIAPAAVANQSPAGYEGFSDVRTMPFARSDMSVTVVASDPAGGDFANGPRFYLVGGCDTDQICYNPNSTEECYCGGLSNKTQYYQPLEDRYVTTPADAPRPRYRHAAAESNGVVYLFGGRTVTDTIIPEVDSYDIANDRWSTTPCTWAGATSDLTAFTAGTKMFVAGGWLQDYSSASSETFEFNPDTCTFTARASMPVAKGDISSITVEKPTGEALHFVVGGFYQDFCNGEKTVASYSHVDDAWTNRADLVLGRADMALGEIDGHIFAIAGETVNEGCTRSVPVTDVERLDVGDGSAAAYAGAWVVEQELPADRFRFGGASHDRAVYLFGGQGAWTDNLDGNGNGGFPVIATTMVYRSVSQSTAPASTAPASTTPGSDDSSASRTTGSLGSVLVAVAVSAVAGLNKW